MKIPAAPHPCQYLELLAFFYVSHTGGGMVFAYCGFNLYSLVRNDVEPHFMYPLPIWRSFVKCLFKSSSPPLLSPFKNQIPFFLLICRDSLYTLETSPLSVICVANISYSLGCLFTLLMTYNFTSSNMSVFSFMIKIFVYS